MKYLYVFLFALILQGCASVNFHPYQGNEKLPSEVSTVRLWSPYVLVRSVDGIKLPAISQSHVYLLPGEHQFNLNLVKVKGMNLLCGALCDELFDNNIVVASTKKGHSYVFKYIDDEKQPKFVLEDKGLDYNPECLDPVNFDPRWKKERREKYLEICK